MSFPGVFPTKMEFFTQTNRSTGEYSNSVGVAYGQIKGRVGDRSRLSAGQKQARKEYVIKMRDVTHFTPVAKQRIAVTDKHNNRTLEMRIIEVGSPDFNSVPGPPMLELLCERWERD